MAFQVKTNRSVTLHHTTSNGNEFSVDFKFINAEDMDYAELREKMEDKKELVTVDEKGKETKVGKGTYNAFLYTLRCSLVGWNNIADENGVDLPFSEEMQIHVFEAIRLEVDLFDKIISAYTGTQGKNL